MKLALGLDLLLERLDLAVARDKLGLGARRRLARLGEVDLSLAQVVLELQSQPPRLESPSHLIDGAHELALARLEVVELPLGRRLGLAMALLERVDHELVVDQLARVTRRD